MKLVGIRVSEHLIKEVEKHLDGSRYHSKSQLFEEILSEWLARREVEDPHHQAWVMGRNPMDPQQIELEYRINRIKEEILKGTWEGLNTEPKPKTAKPGKKPKKG